jgi:hypothetical protein
VRILGTLVSGTGRIASDHLPRTPSSWEHQVLLLSAFSEPAVSERVAEAMRVKSFNPSVFAASLEHLTNARVGSRKSARQTCYVGRVGLEPMTQGL